MLNSQTRKAIKRETDKARHQLEVNLGYFEHDEKGHRLLEILQVHISDSLAEIDRLTQ